jgi:hypothetical protein
MNFIKVKEKFQQYGKAESYDEYEEIYNNLIAKRITSNKAHLGEKFGEKLRIRFNVLTYRQVLLHRAILLFEGSLNALLENNTYLMALSIRGLFETTAALGYLHYRLASFKQGNIKAEKIDRDLCDQLLGTRHDSLSEAPKAKQILDMLEYADKSVNKHILGGTAREYDILTDGYEFLCEFSHPNFHSNAVAIDLDKSIPAFVFRHEAPMREQEFNLISYLLVASSLFLDLFDSLTKILPEKDEK